jgi:hypothetical protein
VGLLVDVHPIGADAPVGVEHEDVSPAAGDDAADVTLAELHLEAFLPADEPTARLLHRRAERA